MKMSTREICIYIKIVRKLTEPLINAYYLKLKEKIAASPTSGAQDDKLPLLGHFLAENHSSSNALHSLHPLILSGVMPVRLRQEIEAMHIQDEAMHIQELASCNGCYRVGLHPRVSELQRMLSCRPQPLLCPYIVIS
jgi:hypothetical protein